MSHLLGFGDYPEAYVGATKAPVKPSAKPALAKGPVPVKTAPKGGKPSPHKAAMVKTIDAGKKALDVAKKAHASVAAYKPAQHAPLVKLAASVSPKGTVMLGAVTAKPLSPKQNLAVAKHANAIARHAQANKRLNIAASKASKAGNDALKFAKVTTPVLKKMFSVSTGIPSRPTGPAHMLGADDLIGSIERLSDEELVRACEMLGVDAAGLMPGMPGYDPSTDTGAQGYMDPNSFAPAAGAGGVDPTSGIVTDPNGNVLYDPSNDPTLQQLPVRGGTLSPSDAQIQWADVPDDGVPYDGSKGFPDGSVGSFNTQYNHADGYEMHADGWYLKRGNDYDHSGPSAPNYGNDQGWGPLVGNPNGPLANLQWATNSKKWFWQSATAPTWATTEADAKITDANNKTIAANTATAVAQLAQMQQDAAANAEAQAKQDAQTALQQSADTQAEAHATSVATQADTVAQQQQSAAQATQDIAYQTQQDAQEAAQNQIDNAAMTAEVPIAAAEDQLDVEAQKAEQNQLVQEAAAHNAWVQAHPDQGEAAYEAAQQQQGQGQGGDDGGGDEFDDGGQSMDDGAPSMFEENAQPQGGDVDPNWPNSDDV